MIWRGVVADGFHGFSMDPSQLVATVSPGLLIFKPLAGSTKADVAVACDFSHASHLPATTQPLAITPKTCRECSGTTINSTLISSLQFIVYVHHNYNYIYIILYYTIVYYIILYYTIVYYIILYCIILYYILLYYTILYYIILYICDTVTSNYICSLNSIACQCEHMVKSAFGYGDW